MGFILNPFRKRNIGFHICAINTLLEILPQIIDYYKNEGYEFKVIKNTSKEENNSNQSENNKDKSSK